MGRSGVTREAMLLELTLKFRDIPESELTFDGIKAMRRGFEELAYEAAQQAPCEHPEGEIINGRCFQCGRAATRADVFAD